MISYPLWLIYFPYGYFSISKASLEKILLHPSEPLIHSRNHVIVRRKFCPIQSSLRHSVGINGNKSCKRNSF